MTRPSRAAVALVAAQFAPLVSRPLDDNRAAVGVSSRGVLSIATASGKVLRTLSPKPPIGNFAISSDGQRVVFSPQGAGYGGPLYLLSVPSGRTEALVHDHYYSRGEVYADPDFSPDGDTVVFAVHAQANGDLVEASGPFATVDLRTRSVHVLPATMDIDSGGIAFANEPVWFPTARSYCSISSPTRASRMLPEKR